MPVVRTNRHKLLRCLPLALLAASACGKGVVGEAMRPDEKTGAQALGERAPAFDCSAVAPAAEPLVVDWADYQRAELGIKLQEGGVVVVHYGCDGLSLLKHCSIEGDYRYAASQLLLGVVELETADAIQASLPVQGASFATELSGDSKINIATAIIGRLGTLVSGPSRSELKGECEGATHYVRSAYVGAFAMATGSKGKGMIAAEIFKAGASAESSSTHSALTHDGDLAACEAHDPDSPTPPSKCRSAIRVELSPIEESGSAPSPAPDNNGLVNTCADGFVAAAGGKCTRKDSGVAYRCDRNDADDCKTQCEKGNADSCYNAALGPLSRVPVAPNSPDYAARQQEDLPYYEKACEGGVGLACNSLGLTYQSKTAGVYDPAKANTYLEKACDELYLGAACLHLGNLLLEGKPPVKKDPKRALERMARACDLGSNNGCVRQGEWQITGHKGVAKNPTEGAKVLDAACNQAKDRYACEVLSDLYRTGNGLPQDEAAATRLMTRACAMGSANAACKK
jgi:hypothetical protein